mmetsp:Transcript_127006/g.219023  ORF Transcript_127006/g.219023 Transcript_127006/m.219023 type:complete len:283 (-) Transcript_127006:67-915(-)
MRTLHSLTCAAVAPKAFNLPAKSTHSFWRLASSSIFSIRPSRDEESSTGAHDRSGRSGLGPARTLLLKVAMSLKVVGIWANISSGKVPSTLTGSLPSFPQEDRTRDVVMFGSFTCFVTFSQNQFHANSCCADHSAGNNERKLASMIFLKSSRPSKVAPFSMIFCITPAQFSFKRCASCTLSTNLPKTSYGSTTSTNFMSGPPGLVMTPALNLNICSKVTGTCIMPSPDGSGPLYGIFFQLCFTAFASTYGSSVILCTSSSSTASNMRSRLAWHPTAPGAHWV